MRQEPSPTFRASELGEPFKPRQLTVPTLVSFIKSPAVLQRVAEQMQVPVSAVSQGLAVAPERNTDLIGVAFASSRSPELAVKTLNAFGQEVVRLTRDMQAQEASAMNRLLQRQLARSEEELRAINREQLDFEKQAGIVDTDKEIDAYLRSLGDLDMRTESLRIDNETLDLKIQDLERELAANNPFTEQLQVAKEKLAGLLHDYTPANPLVEEQKSLVMELEAQQTTATNQAVSPPRQGENGLAATFYAELLDLRTQKKVSAAQLDKLRAVRESLAEKLQGLPAKGMQLARIKARQQSLEAAHNLLASRQREAQLYADTPLEYYRYFESKLEEVSLAGRGKKLGVLAVAGGLLGVFFAAALVALLESLDDRIKTPADLKRATRLPLLATMPQWNPFDAATQTQWAFRTWLALQTRLGQGSHGEWVCGVLAANRGEGASTWVEWLARAASLRQAPVIAITNRPPAKATTIPLAEALVAPASVKCSAGDIQWLLLPDGWSWTPDARSQWQRAREHWSQTRGTVVLAEITGSDQPENLLFAEALPQLLWLAASGEGRARATTEILKLYQNAGCRFAGAVLNRATPLFSWL